MRIFDVFREGVQVDALFYGGEWEAVVTEESVRRDLVEHDGYPPDIEVREREREGNRDGN